MARSRDEDVAPQSLKDQGSLIMEEARTIAPGIQAIFGFQLVAVFNQRFSQDLSQEFQRLHLIAICLIVLAMACLLAPAAQNRLAEPGIISQKFVKLATGFLSFALAFLMAGVALDCFIIANLVTHQILLSGIVGFAIFSVFSGFWFVLPLMRGRKRY